MYKNGGVGAFWAGLSPKMVESASKGAVLLWSKELIKDSCLSLGMRYTNNNHYLFAVTLV